MSIERGAQFNDVPEQDSLPGMEEHTLHRTWREYDPEAVHAQEQQLSMYLPKKALEKALEENHFRNAFETQSGDHGSDPRYMEGRADAERKAFGIPHSADPEDRPVYGVLRQKHGLHQYTYDPENDTPAAPAYAEQRLYGNVMADIRPPHPDQHVTATYGDSMDNIYYGIERQPSHLNMSTYSHSAISPDDYTEVQWHNRPSPREDIEAVHIAGDPMRGQQFFKNPEVGGPEHVAATAEGRANAEQVARDLRISGLPPKTPVYHWQKNVRYQPSLFEDIGIPGQRTEDWSRRRV